ncbi:hypothetical protein DSO57_1017689 [Entomophthora muscae]|uniref:Uncharacterized protein n=1 Tax=Entomophthora muscae TaxID=34485 RepID=A0ACC2T4N6_9FUNG|nr:hypothetical protein DSO57_1017689 [Entomophthora muscae]
MLASAFNAAALSWIFVKWGDSIILTCYQCISNLWRLDWPSYLFCGPITAPPAEFTRKLAHALGGPESLFPNSALALRLCIGNALCQLPVPACCWLLDTLSKHSALFDNMLPMARALDSSLHPATPWPTYLAFLRLRQGNHTLGEFLTIFKAAAAKILLPESAKLAVLKAALDSTGSNLLPWSEPIATLAELIDNLCSYAASDPQHNQIIRSKVFACTLQKTVMAAPPLESGSILGTSGVGFPLLQDTKPLGSTSPIHKPEKTTTRYELKRIKSPMNQVPAASTLCILDAPDEDHHAAMTYPLDGCSCTTPNALPQNLSALNCLSSMTLEGHGESLNYASDNSPLSLCFSSDDNSPDGMPVDHNNPYFVTGLTICQYLGAMTLSPASCIESLLGPRSPNPPSPNGHTSPNPSLISLESANK